MVKEFKILERFVKSKSLMDDIEEIKKMSNNEIKDVLQTHFKFGNSRTIIEPIFEKKYKGEELFKIQTASMFFGILIQTGIKKTASTEDYINDLKELGFKDETIKELEPIFEENIKDFLEIMKEVETPLLNTYCDLDWRIINIKSNKDELPKETIRIEFKILVHYNSSGKHEYLIFEMRPEGFNIFCKEIDKIKKELKNVS